MDIMGFLLKNLKEYGVQSLIMVWLIYRDLTQSKFMLKSIEEINKSILSLSKQISFILSANVTYRIGSEKAGDTFTQQAVREGKLQGGEKE